MRCWATSQSLALFFLASLSLFPVSAGMEVNAIDCVLLVALLVTAMMMHVFGTNVSGFHHCVSSPFSIPFPFMPLFPFSPAENIGIE